MRRGVFAVDPEEEVAYLRRTARGAKRRVLTALADARTGAEIALLHDELREIEWLEARGLTR
jgi:hypothetical protein